MLRTQVWVLEEMRAGAPLWGDTQTERSQCCSTPSAPARTTLHEIFHLLRPLGICACYSTDCAKESLCTIHHTRYGTSVARCACIIYIGTSGATHVSDGVGRLVRLFIIDGIPCFTLHAHRTPMPPVRSTQACVPLLPACKHAGVPAIVTRQALGLGPVAYKLLLPLTEGFVANLKFKL